LGPYRHGRAEEGYQLRGLCLFVSLLAWLEGARAGSEALAGEPGRERFGQEQYVIDHLLATPALGHDCSAR
jgi:hypothetical protein